MVHVLFTAAVEHRDQTCVCMCVCMCVAHSFMTAHLFGAAWIYLQILHLTCRTGASTSVLFYIGSSCLLAE